MALVIRDTKGVTHLLGEKGKALCGAVADGGEVGELTCAACAALALDAIQGTTKAERRKWKELRS